MLTHRLTNLIQRLSDLTPDRVDALYNIDGAQPSTEPTFLFLVGAPGSGKSSGHARAIDAGILPSGNYATINLDTLLESLTPFRAASSMAHFLKRNPNTRNLVQFASIGAYGTRKENLGLFNWYDEAHPALEQADPSTIQQFNRIRAQFAPLKDQEASDRLMDINEAAIQRAIDKGINIVYETTLYLAKDQKVHKVDALMKLLKNTPYRVVFYHITGPIEDIVQRISNRQEHETPQEPYPFYRYVPPKLVANFIQQTKTAYDFLRTKYENAATFKEFENKTDPARKPAENRRNANTRRRRIIGVYGPNSRPNRVSMRPSTVDLMKRYDTVYEQYETELKRNPNSNTAKNLKQQVNALYDEFTEILGGDKPSHTGGTRRTKKRRT